MKTPRKPTFTFQSDEDKALVQEARKTAKLTRKYAHSRLVEEGYPHWHLMKNLVMPSMVKAQFKIALDIANKIDGNLIHHNRRAAGMKDARDEVIGAAMLLASRHMYSNLNELGKEHIIASKAITEAS